MGILWRIALSGWNQNLDAVFLDGKNRESHEIITLSTHVAHIAHPNDLIRHIFHVENGVHFIRANERLNRQIYHR